MTEYRRLLEVLLAQDVEFIVIGGVAAIVHGSARLTQDLDVVYRRSPENLARIVAALALYSPYLRGIRRRMVTPAGYLLTLTSLNKTTDLASWFWRPT